MHDDVDAAESLQHRIDDGLAAFRGRDVCTNEAILCEAFRTRSRGGQYVRTRCAQTCHDRFTHAFRASCHERAAPPQFELRVHQPISNDAILSPAKTNRYESSTGLPGKAPVSRACTVTASATCDALKGSTLYWYFALVSRFQPLMA